MIVLLALTKKPISLQPQLPLAFFIPPYRGPLD